MECPICHQETKQLVIPRDGKLSGRCCSGPRESRRNPRLHDTNVSDGKTRVSNGKAWEIDNRVISRDDGKTVINRMTGKEAQF